MKAWRNGSALDSSPKGCEFDSRRFQIYFYGLNSTLSTVLTHYSTTVLTHTFSAAGLRL